MIIGLLKNLGKIDLIYLVMIHFILLNNQT